MTQAYARSDDRLPMLRVSVDPGPLLYQWRNADGDAGEITDLTFDARDGQVYLAVRARGPDGAGDWSDVPVSIYTDISCSGGGRATVGPVEDGRPTPHHADVSAMDAGPAFTALLDHGSRRVHLQGRLNVGLLVVEVFHEFSEESGRISHYHRECFARPYPGPDSAKP